MRNALRISAAALTVASLSLIAAMPLVASRDMRAATVTTAVSINPLQLMEQVTELPVEQIDDLPKAY
ncbi:MAG TPA: hypothetical protein VNC81_14460 [Xanthobacteraceae bacterium]|jgi:hypothetical protein|nr:hypothetical protein [Xanthobacteraceae bacterium]